MNDTAAWLTLIRAPDTGSGAIAELLEEFGAVQDVIRAAKSSEGGLKQTVREWIRNPDQKLIEADLAWLEADDHHFITIHDLRYPQRLRDCKRPPIALFLVGDPDWLATPQIAIVGSRNPTAPGAMNAREFASELARCGLTITSGLAMGVDTEAHSGALDAGGGTIAVLGTGADRVYPASNRELAHRIAQDGALISEFPIGTAASRENFPQRNRIISGMSLGTLVVEAARQSGSLITARLAGEQGREVFAIPGSIHNPLARGTHQLLKQGAKLVESAADILEELGPLLSQELQPVADNAAVGNVVPGMDGSAIDGETEQLISALGHDPATADQLIERCGLTPEAVSSMLLILELQGRVARTPGGAFIRTQQPEHERHRT